MKSSPEPWNSIADTMTARGEQLVQDVTEEAGQKLMATYHRRLVHELLGAWRAGYDQLDVLQPTDPSLEVVEHWTHAEQPKATVADAFAIQVAFIPHHGGFVPPAGYMGQRFHLGTLTRYDARELREAVAEPPDGTADADATPGGEA